MIYVARLPRPIFGSSSCAVDLFLSGSHILNTIKIMHHWISDIKKKIILIDELLDTCCYGYKVNNGKRWKKTIVILKSETTLKHNLESFIITKSFKSWQLRNKEHSRICIAWILSVLFKAMYLLIEHISFIGIIYFPENKTRELWKN